MAAFQQHYVDLLDTLHAHVEDVAAACFTNSLITPDIQHTITFSPTMPSSTKVTQLLDAVQKSIHDDSKSLLQFVEVLRKQGASLELMGDRLDSTYCECQCSNLQCYSTKCIH